jgi:hypothetical protein
MAPSFQEHSPFREPKWRLDRVLSLLDHRPAPLRPSRRRDDEATAQYYKFLSQWRMQTSEEQRMSLFPRYPDELYAHLLYYHPDKEWRCLIEACILARMTDEEIAQELGTTSGAVSMYEKIFFNVRDRIDREMYIIKQVLGPGEHRRPNRDGALSENQWQSLIKLYAYFGGEQLLRFMLAGFPRGARPRTTREVMTWFDDVLQVNVRKKATVASQTIELNKYNMIQVMELATKLLEIANATSNTATTQSTMDRNVEKVLAELPWVTGRRHANAGVPQLVQFANSAAELRADEMIRVAHGEEHNLTQQEQGLAALRELRVTVS